MSFRIEEKLYIHSDHIINFKEFLIKHLAKQIFHPRTIKSLYFDNLNSEMYNDSIAPLTVAFNSDSPLLKDGVAWLEH